MLPPNMFPTATTTTTTTTIETLEGHLTTLQSLVQSISAIRCHTFPTLINNLQRAIQASQNTSLELVRENWKNHSSHLQDALAILRQEAINSQAAMKYIRAATMNNPNLSSEEKNKAFHDTQLINEKTKQKGFKSSSTLSRRAKATTGITIEKHILEAELIKRKKLKHLEKKHASFPQLSVPVNSLHDCIQRINRLDQDPEEHLIFVSENQLVVKDLMRIFLVFKRTPSPTAPFHPIIERAFCFSLTESPTTTLQRSSFGLIRSINRCINHHINHYFKSDRRHNPSNIWLVCSLLLSYKDFFRSELSVLPRGPNDGTKATHLLATHPQLHQQTRGKMPRDGSSSSRDMMSQGFLTWRRWKVEPGRLDKLVAAPDQQPACAEQVNQDLPPSCGDALELALTGGQWAKVAEMT